MARKPLKPWSDAKPTEPGHYWLWLDWPRGRPFVVRLKTGIAPDQEYLPPDQRNTPELLAHYTDGNTLQVERLWCAGQTYWCPATPPPDTK